MGIGIEYCVSRSARSLSFPYFIVSNQYSTVTFEGVLRNAFSVVREIKISTTLLLLSIIKQHVASKALQYVIICHSTNPPCKGFKRRGFDYFCPTKVFALPRHAAERWWGGKLRSEILVDSS